MKFKEFIGIDVSKATLDVFLYCKQLHAQFDNNKLGFRKMIKWIKQQSQSKDDEILFAFEHTGLYSLNLSLFLDEHQYAFTIISGLELKRSRGIKRGKNDKIDAKEIAGYAYEKKDRIRLYQMPSETILKLKRLTSYRERLVRDRAAFKNRLKGYKTFLDSAERSQLIDSNKRMINALTEEIKTIESELYSLIKKDQKLLRQFKLINTVKCVGPQTALMMIILTDGFTRFETWRKFSSYAGIAPFPNESGTYKGKARISQLANKRIKTLLSCCANCAIQYSPEMRIYFTARTGEGKNEMSTLNIIRNKLLSRIFAVVRRGTPYVDTYRFAA